MRKAYILSVLLLLSLFSFSQTPAKSPCKTETVYRQFDFWIGEWEAFGLNGKKGGDSRIELILDSCTIMENWTGMGGAYTGKSFNLYNSATGQWQQTWVDNMGGTTEFLRGTAENGKVVFYADNVIGPGGKKFQRRLSFYKLDADRVRQHGERSEDEGKTWKTEYDLEYRRKK